MFSGRDPDETPFMDATWRTTLLVGGLGLEEEAFHALAESARQCGDELFLVAGLVPVFPQQPIFECDWRLEDLDPPGASVLGRVYSGVCGRAGNWGLVTSFDSFGVLGGPQAFIDDFERRAGGRDRLINRFEEAESAGSIGWKNDAKWLMYSRVLKSAAGWPADQ